MPGEILGLIGPNGAGKTTCFNLITGFYEPSAGTVSFRGQDITGERPFAIAQKGIVRSFQKTNILKQLSVFENVLAGHYLEARQSLFATFFPAPARQADRARGARQRGRHRRHHGTVQAHQCTGLPAVLRRVAPAGGGGGAGGQADAADAGRAGGRPEQPGSRAPSARSLKKLRKTRAESILIVEHNMGLVMKTCDRIVVMNFGEKLAEGTPAEILANRQVIEAYLGKAAA